MWKRVPADSRGCRTIPNRAAIGKRIGGIFRKEPVLSVSAAAAALSMAVTPPCVKYIAYVDWNVLMLLFCLMAVVAGIRETGALTAAANAMLGRAGNARRLSLLLTMLCFASATLVTNDVALIAFVPLALVVTASAQGATIPTVILMTIAANLGSMLTPIGNPQNLYLYSYYSLSAGEMARAVAPYAFTSLALLALAQFLLPKAKVTAAGDGSGNVRKKPLFAYGALFLLCLTAVLKWAPVWICFIAVAVYCLIFDRKSLRKVDWSLLATFVCFFVLVGNLAGSEAVRGWIGSRLAGSELLFGASASQVISNVPAAILLSSFTDNWKPLLIGVNIGGLGTPVASLASLISYRLYARSAGAKPGRYMIRFLLWNIAFLALLLTLATILTH